MKTTPASHSHPRKSGFTLVELLVVIAIIAILASVILFASGAAIKAAKRVKAGNLAIQLQTSALGYYTEYSVYPIPSTQTAGADFIITDASGSATTWAGMIYGLCGNVNPYTGLSTPVQSAAVPNTRVIAFMTLKNSDVDANNAPLNPIPPSTANPYFNMAVDGDYDNILGATPSAVANKMPAFSPATIGGTIPLTGTSTTGIAVWANCTGSPTLVNSNQWVHTY